MKQEISSSVYRVYPVSTDNVLVDMCSVVHYTKQAVRKTIICECCSWETVLRSTSMANRDCLPMGKSGTDVKLTTHLHVVLRSRIVEFYLHSHHVSVAWYLRYRVPPTNKEPTKKKCSDFRRLQFRDENEI